MKLSQTEAPRLLDLRALGDFLGISWRSLERQLLKPPPGFPQPRRLGRRVFWSRLEIENWLEGKNALGPAVQVTNEKKRGRPPNKPALRVDLGVAA